MGISDLFFRSFAVTAYSDFSKFTDDYILQLNRVAASVDESVRVVEYCIRLLQDRVEDARSDLRTAESELQMYLSRFQDARDEKGNALKPDPSRVHELESAIRRAEEKVYKATRRLREGEDLSHTIKMELSVVQASVYQAHSSVSDKSSALYTTVNRVVDRIEKYMHS